MVDLVETKPRRKRASKPSKPIDTAGPIPPRDEVAVREAAYYLWELEGRPEGRAVDHWLEAARQSPD